MSLDGPIEHQSRFYEKTGESSRCCAPFWTIWGLPSSVMIRRSSSKGKDEPMDVLKLQPESLLCPQGWRNLRCLTGGVLSLGCLFLVGVLFPQVVVADAERERDHQLKYEQKVQEIWDERAKSLDPESWKRYDECRKCVTRKPGYWYYYACVSSTGDRERSERVGGAQCLRYAGWGSNRKEVQRHCEALGYGDFFLSRLKEEDCAIAWFPGIRHGWWERYIHEFD